LITLVLGGASSGKSAVAERLAAALPPPVTYVATWRGDEAGMAEKVAAHRARRPPEWRTIEAGPDLRSVVASTPGTLLVDALGVWVAQAAELRVDAAGLCRALRERNDDCVIVSDEVGLGVHPSSELGRRFREVLGSLNLEVAAVADRVLLVVAGRVIATEKVAP